MATTDRLVRIGFVLAVNVSFLSGCGGSPSSSSSNSPALNPVPSIASLSPSSLTSCGAGFNLKVSGSDFVPSSTVQWNGASRTTTFVSASNIAASISASDVAVGGTAEVTVMNPAPGGGTSAAANFDIACAIQISIDSQSQQLATVNEDVFGANLPSSMDFT